MGAVLPRAEVHRRGCSRLRLGIPARLETYDGNQKVRLLDLSHSGAQLQIVPQAPFKSAVVCWLKYEVFGTVVWQAQDRVGIEFDETICSEWIIETRMRAPEVVRDEHWSARRAASEWAAGSLGGSHS